MSREIVRMPSKLSDRDLLLRALRVLDSEVDRLEKWANETESGGWSTWFVRPMRERAEAIKAVTSDIRRHLHAGL